MRGIDAMTSYLQYFHHKYSIPEVVLRDYCVVNVAFGKES